MFSSIRLQSTNLLTRQSANVGQIRGRPSRVSKTNARSERMDDFDFTLSRFAVITSTNPALLPTAPFQVNGCDISVERPWDFQIAGLPLTATWKFSAPHIDGKSDARLVSARSHAERAIVEATRILAIATGASIALESRHPLFAVWWPSGSGGRGLIRGDWVIADMVQRPELRIAMADVPFAESSLRDRPAGAALLSQALATNTAIGKYIAFCQLFENAFASPLGQLAQTVATFLAGNSLRYSLVETEHWFAQRGSAAHGDLRIAKQLADEVEIGRFVFRMQQAAYDVLFNKATWHDRSLDRRDIWRPTTAVLDDPNDFQFVAGVPTNVQMRLFDPYTGWKISDSPSWLQSPHDGIEIAFPTTDTQLRMNTHVVA